VHGYAADGLQPGVHRGLPGPELTLVLAVDAPLAVAATAADHAAGRLHGQAVTLSGLHTEPAFVVQPGRWSGIQVDLHPLGVRRLFHLPAAALPTTSFDARDVLGAEVDLVHEQLASAPSWAGRYQVVLEWLLGRLARSEPGRVRPEVVRAWQLLGQQPGGAGVRGLAADVGLGSRRLAQVFRAETGVTPKVAARLMRFDAARRAVAAAAAAAGPLDLSGVAVRHGYYDHAHLVREFGAFAGLSPTAWLAAEVGNVQAAPGARAAS
jgi:AraC-like DNA-binding protein